MSYKILRIYSIPYVHVYEDFILNNKDIANLNYQETQERFLNQKISYSDVFSRNMKKLGNKAEEIICNFEYLQNKWAKEKLSKNNQENLNTYIQERQIEEFKPEVIFFQNSPTLNIKNLKKKFSFIKKIVVHCGFDIKKELLEDIDLLFVTPHLYEKFKNNFKNLYQLQHYFDESILENINKRKKKNFLIFSGKTGSSKNLHHKFRFNLLQKICLNFDIKIYSDEYGRKIYYSKINKLNLKQKIYRILNFMTAPKNNEIFLHDLFPKNCFYPIYGMEMYDEICSSNLVLNSHTDVSRNYSANMRLFETTGIGTCIITENSKNINSLFSKDQIITYNDQEDCIRKINYYKNNLEELKEISLRGQKQTLEKHNSYIRISEIDEIIKKYL